MKVSFVFSLSLPTNPNKFDQKVKDEGLPVHDFNAINWKQFEKEMKRLIVEDLPAWRKNQISLKVFPDALDGLSKSRLTDEKVNAYCAETSVKLLDGDTGQAAVDELRKKYMLTDYSESIPPEVFTFTLSFNKKGDLLTSMEYLFMGVFKHFNDGLPIFQNAYAAFLPRGGDTREDLRREFPQKLSNDMLQLFTRTFDHPFTDDIGLFCSNEASARFYVEQGLKAA